MLHSILFISAGASAGAVSRWLLGRAFNALYPAIPLGTLAANLIGGYGMGLAMGIFALLPGLAPEWRLFIMTGFLGALTTYSTFSGEVVSLLQEGRFGMACLAATLHLGGSLGMTILGLATVALIRSLGE